MEEFNSYYKFGNQTGGGAPIRDKSGRVLTQHPAFANQSRKNGGIEIRDDLSRQESAADLNTCRRSSSFHSPTRNELVHMRPSNLFADITEEQFNQKEAEKNQYKADLLHQIQTVSRKKAEEKR